MINNINSKKTWLGFVIIFLFLNSRCFGESAKDAICYVFDNLTSLNEERAHDEFLERSEDVARSKSFYPIDARLEEQYISGGANSGFLSSAQLRIPLFNKNRSDSFIKVSQLDREIYTTFRKLSLAERLYQFRLVYYKNQGISIRLPDLIIKRNILEDLERRQRGLINKKLKDSSEMDNFYDDLILADNEIRFMKARFKTTTDIIEVFLNNIDSSTATSTELVPVEKIRALIKDNADIFLFHPKIVKLKLELDKQNISQKLVSGESIPNISIMSSYTHDPRFNSNENQMYAGVEARWLLWDFGVNRHNIEKEKALIFELEAKLEKSRTEFIVRINEAMRLYEASYTAWVERNDALRTKLRVLLRNRRRFLKGEISWKELALERIKYIDKKIALEEAKEEALIKETGLIFALGRFEL